MIDPELLSQEYGYIGENIFLNASSVSLPPMRVRNACRRFMDDYADSMSTTVYDCFDDIRANAKKELAKLLHADPGEIAFTKNTSEGNSLLACGLNLQPGDNVIIADIEHGALIHPWLQTQRRGVEVRIVKSVNGAFSPESIFALADEHTRVIAVSAVQYLTGFLCNLRKIGSFCRKNGILFAVDAIQALGRVPLNVMDMNIDYLSCGGFKALLGTLGVGMIYCRKELIPQIEPSIYANNNVISTEHMISDAQQGIAPELRSDILRFEAGSYNTYGINALLYSAGLINEIGVQEIYRTVVGLEEAFREKMKEFPVFVPYDYDPEAGRSGVVCMKFSDGMGQIIEKKFSENKIYATIHEQSFRLSLGFYNTESQMNTVIKCLGQCAQEYVTSAV